MDREQKQEKEQVPRGHLSAHHPDIEQNTTDGDSSLVDSQLFLFLLLITVRSQGVSSVMFFLSQFPSFFITCFGDKF